MCELLFWRLGCGGLGGGLGAGGGPREEGADQPLFPSCAGRRAFAASTSTARPARRRSAPRTRGRRRCGARWKVGPRGSGASPRLCI